MVVLLSRAKYLYQTEGLVRLLRRGVAFLARYFFQFETYCLYEHRLEEMNEADFMPRIRDFNFKIISTNQQADELTAEGFESLSQDGIHRNRLDKGAIAFTIFIARELAHIGWVAMSEEALRSIIGRPFHVDFSNNNAYNGGAVTDPKYRGMGLHTYSLFKSLQFQRERGFTASRILTTKSNVASRRVLVKLGYNMYAEDHYLKILCWESWKEKPLSANELTSDTSFT